MRPQALLAQMMWSAIYIIRDTRRSEQDSLIAAEQSLSITQHTVFFSYVTALIPTISYYSVGVYLWSRNTESTDSNERDKMSPTAGPGTDEPMVTSQIHSRFPNVSLSMTLASARNTSTSSNQQYSASFHSRFDTK
jgi:hypothetical protein